MAKLTILVVIILAVIGSFCALNSFRFDQPENTVVCYATRDLEKGKILTREDVEQRDEPGKDIPPFPLRDASKGVGLKLKKGLKGGEVIQYWHFEKPPWKSPVKVIMSTRKLLKSEVATRESLEEVWIDRSLLYPDAAFDVSKLTGKRAKYGVGSRQFLSNVDFE